MKIDMFVFAILFAFAVCGTAQTEDEPTPPPTEEATDDLTEKVIEDLDRVIKKKNEEIREKENTRSLLDKVCVGLDDKNSGSGEMN